MSIVIGVSSCLLGRQVRFDGGHKRDAFVVDTLAPHVRFVPVCPEVELGLGTPRETLRLIRRDGDVRMVMQSGEDYTDAMRLFARRRVIALGDEDLDGYILKKDSPSCGLTRVKVHAGDSEPIRDGEGLFARVLKDHFPHLPMEDEGRLLDPGLRDNFIERVFAYRRLKTLFSGRWTLGQVVAFHTAHKFVLLAHSVDAYRALGRLVAEGRAQARMTLRDRYRDGFMTALGVVATRRNHTNVLMHMVGHFRGQLDSSSRDHMLTCIDDYRCERLPLVVPVTLIRQHARRLGIDYLAGQVYLDPHPKEVALRS
jgi:uncharacterized protein YbgA (DUF1722 family)/uncharacterized protein YbbK (DUF523 family)